MNDIIIIGAGIIGGAVARELARYRCRITVLEKENDVAAGTSKANSGIIHAGFNAPFGSLKAKYNVMGNRMYDKTAAELDFPFKRTGAVVLGFTENEFYKLKQLYQNGINNGIADLSLLTKEEVLKLEPNISPRVYAALYAPTSGITGPYEATIAYAEGAALNGVDFVFNSAVTAVNRENNRFIVTCGQKKYRADVIVNCAGVYADAINNMISPEKIKITPVKGEYLLVDKSAKPCVSRTIFTLPTDVTKGVLVTPTVHGNTIVGPTAYNVNDKDDVATTISGLNEAWSKGVRLVPALNKKAVISQFAGLRAYSDLADFIVGFAAPGFYNLAGMVSPGLSGAPALAEQAARDIALHLNLAANSDFIVERKGIPAFNQLSSEEKVKLIKTNPRYANIICRCEAVSEGEIVEAIRRYPGARDLDGIKRRTRAGMGRCQGGFCMPKVAAILAKELSLPFDKITKKGGSSYLVSGKVRQQ